MKVFVKGKENLSFVEICKSIGHCVCRRKPTLHWLPLVEKEIYNIECFTNKIIEKKNYVHNWIYNHIALNGYGHYSHVRQLV